MKIQNKTIVLLLAGFLSIIIIICSFVYVSIANYLSNDFYKLLKVRAYTLAVEKYADNSYASITEDSTLRHELDEKLLHEKDYFFNRNSNLETAALTVGIPIAVFTKTIREGEAEYKIKDVFYKTILYKSENGEQHIVVSSAQNYQEDRLKSYLRRTLIFAIGATLLLSIIFAIYSSRNIFKPLLKITEQVKQISSENLHLRLDGHKKNNELNELATTFNNMLDRIETSFETQNNFISNASHELRTPLTAIIGEADVTLSKPRTQEEYIETIKIILDEAEKLDGKTKALLFLAQTGFNGKVQKFDKVRIDQLLWDVKETLEKINGKNIIHIDMSLLPENPMKLKVNGNEQLLHLAFTNIISNACKYSNCGDVYVSLGASDNKVFIVVKDLGIGIPTQELKHIYDPFFRASNTKNYEGYGIGLPLTQTIIKMHKGNLKVSSQENKGTTVQIDFPTWTEQNKTI